MAPKKDAAASASTSTMEEAPQPPQRALEASTTHNEEGL
jgi:hypothetical protein